MVCAVLWDLDGTLVDSEEYHWRAWRDALAAEGVAISHGQFAETFGWRNDAIIPRWLPGVSDADVVRIGDAKEAAYRRMVREQGLDPLPGVAACVCRLASEGWRQAVATSAPRENVHTVLEVTGLAACFQALVSAEDVRNGKPDPEVFLTAARRLDVPPARSIVVEDAPAGVEAAHRAGMRCIGVESGRKLNADLVVRSIDDLPADAFRTLLAL
jgi:beta-phosphoglucomutase